VPDLRALTEVTAGGGQGAGRRRAEAAYAAAFAQACREAGVGPHPGGVCPDGGCRCEELSGRIAARALDLMKPGLDGDTLAAGP
jgi:hypothetical protein